MLHNNSRFVTGAHMDISSVSIFGLMPNEKERTRANFGFARAGFPFCLPSHTAQAITSIPPMWNIPPVSFIVRLIQLNGARKSPLKTFKCAVGISLFMAVLTTFAVRACFVFTNLLVARELYEHPFHVVRFCPGYLEYMTGRRGWGGEGERGGVPLIWAWCASIASMYFWFKLPLGRLRNGRWLRSCILVYTQWMIHTKHICVFVFVSPT